MASRTRSRTVVQAHHQPGSATCLLLALPDPCLLAVMQCCASDTRSVLSATTAHSRLQQAAVEALSSIAAEGLEQRHLDSLLLYLAKHGRHVRSLAVRVPEHSFITRDLYFDVQLLELPPSLTKLDSLQLEGMALQLQPDVLRAGLPLTRLELSECSLLDGSQGLAAALAQLPDLQHLSVARLYDELLEATFNTDVLSRLTKLTSLQFRGVKCQESSNSSSDDSAALQPLQALTRLADLQLSTGCAVTAGTLSRADQLTRLVLFRQWFDPQALAGKTQLQHLTLYRCSFVPGTGVAQLLSEVQHLTQLTHLDLNTSCRWDDRLFFPSPPPAAFASLTASSKLQHLAFSHNTLPSAAWQYMCPPGRTLPQLRHLNITCVEELDLNLALPDTNALVSCCPGLQSLITSMPCSTAQLAPLQRLTGLHTLTVGAGQDDELEGVQALCQLTGLHQLHLKAYSVAQSRLLQLTQLKPLTHLSCPHCGTMSSCGDTSLHSQDPASEPVWRQLLQQLVACPDAEVAQQAAAAALEANLMAAAAGAAEVVFV